MPGYNSPALAASAPAQTGAGFSETTEQATATASATQKDGDGRLPDQVAYLPTANPVAAFPATPQTPSPQAAETALAQAARTTEREKTAAGETTKPVETAGEQASGTPAPDARTGAAADAPATAAVQGEDAQPAAETAPSEPPKKKTLFASLFGAKPASAAPSPMITPGRSTAAASQRQQPGKAVIENQTPTAFIENRPGKPVIEEETDAKPVLNLDQPARKPIVLASYGSDGNGLPGVRTTALFEIKRKSGIDDDSDVDLHEEDEGASIQLASAAGMARLAPNGLLKQTESVDVACLKPSLVRVLKTIEQRYGRKLMVTSGYRSRIRNIRARGAKNSLHMYCAAADIQVPGVGKLELANFLRSMPGRGGVGTYCHTNSVHVDVGPERDWNWRCRRRK
ncbi:D-Ala-D-Ala carboxypeptidase family metallohydrolase [Mesorhizobium sp. LHD-90]|uniref:YcbK family protein n=1 Tax=Mesorhizobium sp. LHD-90 TaxID=3071414 RepID=UPI0027DFA65E|nr:D-Ala-D-Ala carboxypeptidase family metallohydrolase [Mesorhizobium sp. LHD-90]MDQ6438268.1 D-Ala-D-Ala carboxypeptidase family metallohydrolase [Mesorhizobium sp. LHD-90]